MAITPTASDSLKTLNPAAASTRSFFSNRRRPWTPGYGLKATPSAAALVVGVNHPGTLAEDTERVTIKGLAQSVTFSASGGVLNGAASISDTTVTTDIDLTGVIWVGAVIKFGALAAEHVVTAITSTVITFTPALATTVADASAIKYGVPYTYTVPASTVTLPLTSNLTEAGDYANAILIVYPGSDYTNGVIVPRVKYGGVPTAAAFWKVTAAGTFVTTNGVDSSGDVVDWAAGDTLELLVPVAGDIETVLDQTAHTVVDSMDIMVAGGSGKTGIVYLNRIYV